MQLARAIRRDDDNRRSCGADGAKLGNRDLKIGEQLEKEPLELLVGAVQLVDEQHGRPLSVRQRLEQRPPDQKFLCEQLTRRLPSVDRARGFHQADLQQLPRVVPFVHGVAYVQAFVALEPDQVRLET